MRAEIEKELEKDTLESLREGFKERLWIGREGTPSVQQLVDALLRPTETTGCCDPEFMLETLCGATEISVARLVDADETLSENHRVWKSAKLLMGRVATLAVRAESVEQNPDDAPYEEIALETAIAVEAYTSRKKRVPANFRKGSNSSTDDGEEIVGGKQLTPFFPEVGWDPADAVDQLQRTVWRAAGFDERKAPLTETELATLKKTLHMHRTRLRDQSKYPPAEPGALVCEPLEAAKRGR